MEFFESEDRGCRDVRKHASWYFKGYPIGGDLRGQFSQVTSLDHIDELIAQLDLDAPYPGAPAEGLAGGPAARSDPYCPRAG